MDPNYDEEELENLASRYIDIPENIDTDFYSLPYFERIEEDDN